SALYGARAVKTLPLSPCIARPSSIIPKGAYPDRVRYVHSRESVPIPAAEKATTVVAEISGSSGFTAAYGVIDQLLSFNQQRTHRRIGLVCLTRADSIINFLMIIVIGIEHTF